MSDFILMIWIVGAPILAVVAVLMGCVHCRRLG